jgi:polar amino acid transport system substrate-binding protein
MTRQKSLTRQIWRSVTAAALALTAIGLASGAGRAEEAPSLNGKPLPGYSASEGGLITEIKTRGKLVNGVEAQNPPFEYIEGGKIIGYDIELSELFARHLGVELETIDTAWSGVIPSLYTKKFDTIWSAMTITEPRKQAVTFSMPYASDQVEFITRAGNDKLTKLEDLNNKLLGTQLNSAAELQAKELIAKQNLKIELKAFDHFDGAYLDLKNGNVDAVTSTKLNDRVLFEKNPGVFKVAFTLPIYNLVGVATRKPDADLSKAVDGFIAELKASGKLAELQKKWFGYVMDLPQ